MGVPSPRTWHGCSLVTLWRHQVRLACIAGRWQIAWILSY